MSKNKAFKIIIKGIEEKLREHQDSKPSFETSQIFSMDFYYGMEFGLESILIATRALMEQECIPRLTPEIEARMNNHPELPGMPENEE